MNLNSFTLPLIAILLLWTLAWHGLALWHSARLEQRNWFIVLLVLSVVFNSLGLVDIIYLFFFAKKRFDYKTLLFWKK